VSANGNSYDAAGVSIERGERSVGLVRSALEATHSPAVLGGSGGFAGLYALSGYAEPVLASTIDGVGTKVLVARAMGRYDSLGADIVNHCANDVLATGARPLLFLDYVASGRLVPEAVASVVRSAARACEALGVSLVGGETAEMPGLYAGDDLDVVGACVGACERSELVTGEKVKPGDAVIGLPSSGLHTNGYSLARKTVEEAGLSYREIPEGFDRPFGEVLLEPHRAYVKEILALRGAVEVRGLAHVTGGGLVDNLPRALGGHGAQLDTSSWREPRVFGLIRALSGVPEAEMRRVFNLGVGFCVVVPAAATERALETLQDLGECAASRIGEVVEEGGIEFA
jgi:phosphoribosylformylglycinamidine cyclo-ligase